jgi:hypothetical protein
VITYGAIVAVPQQNGVIPGLSGGCAAKRKVVREEKVVPRSADKDIVPGRSGHVSREYRTVVSYGAIIARTADDQVISGRLVRSWKGISGDVPKEAIVALPAVD